MADRSKAACLHALAGDMREAPVGEKRERTDAEDFARDGGEVVREEARDPVAARNRQEQVQVGLEVRRADGPERHDPDWRGGVVAEPIEQDVACVGEAGGDGPVPAHR